MKSGMLDQVREMHQSSTYMIQNVANQFGDDDFSIRVLFTPIARMELYPIEMVRGLIKRIEAAKILHFERISIDKEAFIQIANMTAEKFTKIIEHSTKEEEKLMN